MRVFKVFNYHQNNPREGFSMRGIDCALPNLENATLTLIQERDVFIEANSESEKCFQGPAMRVNDFSHRKPPIRLFGENF